MVGGALRLKQRRCCKGSVWVSVVSMLFLAACHQVTLTLLYVGVQHARPHCLLAPRPLSCITSLTRSLIMHASTRTSGRDEHLEADLDGCVSERDALDHQLRVVRGKARDRQKHQH